jgi:TatA/E family protein of Tat protein translocase
MGPFGVQEMMVIFILALLLFGPKKLPELARLLAKGLTEFRRAKNELKSTLDTHMRELEREVNLEDAKKNPPAAVPAYKPYSYMADEHGKVSSDYGYNGASEPPVESHALTAAETPSLPPAPPPEGAIPRYPSNGAFDSNGSADVAPASPTTTGQVHDEHHA